MSSVQQLQDPTDTTGTLNPLHGKDIDRFEHVRPPEHAPLQQVCWPSVLYLCCDF